MSDDRIVLRDNVWHCVDCGAPLLVVLTHGGTYIPESTRRLLAHAGCPTPRGLTPLEPGQLRTTP